MALAIPLIEEGAVITEGIGSSLSGGSIATGIGLSAGAAVIA